VAGTDRAGRNVSDLLIVVDNGVSRFGGGLPIAPWGR
jgi:hypothetical protein